MSDTSLILNSDDEIPNLRASVSAAVLVDTQGRIRFMGAKCNTIDSVRVITSRLNNLVNSKLLLLLVVTIVSLPAILAIIWDSSMAVNNSHDASY